MAKLSPANTTTAGAGSHRERCTPEPFPAIAHDANLVTIGVTTQAVHVDADGLQPTATSTHTGPIEATRMLRWLRDEEANAQQSERDRRESDRVIALTRKCQARTAGRTATGMHNRSHARPETTPASCRARLDLACACSLHPDGLAALAASWRPKDCSTLLITAHQ
jgi:hypothetical protein